MQLYSTCVRVGVRGFRISLEIFPIETCFVNISVIFYLYYLPKVRVVFSILIKTVLF